MIGLAVRLWSLPVPSCLAAWALACCIALTGAISGNAQDFIPRKQTQPPGPPLSPEEALAKMQVPPGFRVELVAAEPEIMNPVAMAFDDRGRIYVTESFEYPRREPGPGRDRIKILEDRDGDGRFETVTVFAEGLNIPSGIAVGHGGVWVANAPDLLFLEDTDGDDRADKQTVVVTGFGRDDTHELPNALTWGPDGFLYGLNGVFNPSTIRQGDQTFAFTCAMFRIDPTTHRFELFCEGTSNPWGIAFDHEGEAFVSACVIDHLWHFTETGYYHRQGGPYPPHTWPIQSIVDHKHQMAAYCGIEFFDSPAYPPEYSNRLYMGNIHGGCINVDSVQRRGSTYHGQGHPDFLTANDVWFMPVAQKIGPDGCLYVLDWYDRYHCYQDANADPDGVDRGRGRLYRVVHEKRPEIEHRDLLALSDLELIDLLSHANLFYRQRAAVILLHRHRLAAADNESSQPIEQLLLSRLRSSLADGKPSLQLLTTALSTAGSDGQWYADLAQQYADHPRELGWLVRTAGEAYRQAAAAPGLVDQLDRLVATGLQHPAETVRLQAVIAGGKSPSANLAGAASTGAKLAGATTGDARWTETLLRAVQQAPDDGLFSQIVWPQLHPRLASDRDAVVAAFQQSAGAGERLSALAPRIADRLLSGVRSDLSGPQDQQTVAAVLAIAAACQDTGQAAVADQVQSAIVAKLQTGEIRPAAAQPLLASWLQSPTAARSASLPLSIFAGTEAALQRASQHLLDRDSNGQQRAELLETVAIAQPMLLLPVIRQCCDDLVAGQSVDPKWRDAVFTAVLRRGDDDCRQQLMVALGHVPVGVQAMVATQLLQSPALTQTLLQSIARGEVGKDLLGPDQMKQLAASSVPEIQQLTREIWGNIRMDDANDRSQVIREVTEFLTTTARGDAHRGWAVFDRTCGQCHKMHGRGYEVGPEITRNGRGNFEQLIISVFDPSLVVGEAYQSVSVLTVDGRVVTGLVTERTDQRLVLKVQGGTQEIVLMDDVDEIVQNDQSLMPSGLEASMTQQELADLFALLSLEQSPEVTPQALIAGTPEQLHEQ